MLPSSRRRHPPFKHHGSGTTAPPPPPSSSNPTARMVIQRTTSETLRIERDVEVTNNHHSIEAPPQPQPQPTPIGCTVKKPQLQLGLHTSSFIVTNIIPRQDYCEASDSPEPDSCSIDTPSISEDTQSYSRDLDEHVPVTATCPIQEEGIEDRADSSQRADGRYIGRFQVVKVESMGKFKRGRWHYQDYLDDSPHVPRDGYVFRDGCFVRNVPNVNENTSLKNSTRTNVSTVVEPDFPATDAKLISPNFEM